MIMLLMRMSMRIMMMSLMTLMLMTGKDIKKLNHLDDDHDNASHHDDNDSFK